MTVSSIRTPASSPLDHEVPPTDDDPAARWRAWRATRAAELRRPHGWLSLTGFAWLGAEPASVPGVPGRWSADDEAVTLTAQAADGLQPTDDGVAAHRPPGEPATTTSPFVVPPGGPLVGTVRVAVPDGGSVVAVRHGDRRIELLRRAGRPALRIRDPHAATRTGFRGVPTHDWDARWVVPARVVPTAEPVHEVVLTARPDLLTTAVTHGRVDFELAGRSLALSATVGADGGLTVAFRDPTNDVTTASWRVLSTAPPDDRGRVVLDFNRAVNPPFAFTPYGTCPAPVAANRLPVPVTAGELAPAPAIGGAW